MFEKDDLLFKRRQILIDSEINSRLANEVILKLLHLLEKSRTDNITLIINSPGGSVYDGMAILDTMDYIKSEGIIIETLCIGKAASMGGVILAHGTYNYRRSLKNSMIMLHQPLMTVQDTTFTEKSLKIQSEQMTALRNKLEKGLSEDTGENIKSINSILDNDCYFTPKEALNFGTKGIIDEIIGTDCKTKEKNISISE